METKNKAKTYKDYVNTATDVNEAAKVWAGISPNDLEVDFNNIEKLSLKELLDTNVVFLSVKESQGEKGTYYTCLCVSEKHPNDIFIMSTGASAVSRKLKIASLKKRIPMKGKIVTKIGKEDQEYFDCISDPKSSNNTPDKKDNKKKKK